MSVVAVGASVAACSTGGTGVPQCEDGVDNDGDGFIDGADVACVADPAGLESADPPHACEDGVDNDGDGFTDFPADPNCDSALDQDEFGPLPPQCMDGRDNDGDGATDYPDDPGCLVPNQDSEADDCPDGPACPACANGVDDDVDGLTDFAGHDPGCESASDDDEFELQPGACGPGVDVLELPGPAGFADVAIPPAGSQLASPTCGGAGGELAFVLAVAAPSTMIVTTTGTTDTVLYVRRNCMNPATELACNDDDPAAVPAGVGSRVELDVQPGSYFIVVDGKGLATTGPVHLTWQLYAGLGEACAGPPDCAPGYVCRLVPGAPTTTCERPVCSDGRDDDQDGLVDYPLDPGCLVPGDATEDDDCPGGPNCPECANAIDDDGDTFTDYPDDPSCAAASSGSEADCPIEVDPILAIDEAIERGTTAGAGAGLGPHSCGGGIASPDRVYTLAVREPLATLVLDLSDGPAGTTDYDSVIALYDDPCLVELGCDDDGGTPGSESRLALANVAAGQYAVVIDGSDGVSGRYTLHTSGTYGPGAACDPLSPWFTCQPGNACTGLPGSATCQQAACSDGADDDGDGHPDFPADPGCTSASDGDEGDDCPGGPGCPECGNGLDDDGDGVADFPADGNCAAASTASESCTSFDPVRALTVAQLTQQSTLGLGNDLDLSCGLDGRDEVYRLRVDHPIDSLQVDTIGSALDAVIGVRRPDCSSADLVCDDNSGGGTAALATIAAPAVGTYFVVVEDRGVQNPGTYSLHVTGHYLDHGRCSPDTPFTCHAGWTCTGLPGAETCTAAACDDHLDDDGDGLVDFPADPGCTSASDDSEVDACPGPGCPVCANGLDDDGDGLVDYPADPMCASAAGDNELAACASLDPVILFSQDVVGATTAGKANDLDLSCGADGRDDVYRILVTRPLVSLSVDTLASDTATAVALRRGTCNGTSDLACGVNNFGTNDARASITSVAPGEYFAVVDDLNTPMPTLYNLRVRGVLMGAAPCDPTSTTFVCDAGFTCGGPPGATVCVPGPCNDTVDADGDGRVGFPSDPGCSSPSDLDESDACNLPGGPPGPGCPRCANGLDDDGDGAIDWPNDPGCTAASRDQELDCRDTDPFIDVTAPAYAGTTVGAANDFAPAACGSSLATSSPDRVHVLTLPVPVATLVMDTEDSTFDTTLAFGPPACAPVIACDDDGGTTGNNSRITRSNVAAGTYTIIVDGFSTGAGPYNLHVQGTVAAGTACGDPLFAAGVLACAPGTACNGGTCQ